MRHKNSLAIFLRTLLLLSMLFIVGCADEDDEADPTSAGSPATLVLDAVVSTPRTTPTPTRAWPTPEIILTETPMPTPLPGYAATPAARRVIFILDNSDSVVEECFAIRQEPAHSEARQAMSDMVVFLVNLFGELERAAATRSGTPSLTIEVGVYALHPYHDVWTAQPLRELVAVQDVAELRAGWDEPMAALLDARSINMYGWDVDWLGGTDSGAAPLPSVLDLGETGHNVVILLTDGYTGVPPTPAPGAAPAKEPSEVRRQFGQQLSELPGNIEFNVVQFNCPNLATDLGAWPTPDGLYKEEQMMRDDAHMWQELAELKDDGGRGIEFYPLNLPRSAWPRHDLVAAWQSFAPVAQSLLAQLNVPALCPPITLAGDYGLAGSGWLSPADAAGPAATEACVTAGGEEIAPAHRLPSRDAPGSLPGDTATFALRLVAASGGSGGYSVFFRRGGQTFRYALNEANAGHVYAIGPEDHVLREVLAAAGELCGPIEWWVEGPGSVSFAWWETQPVRYSVRAALEENTIVNNGHIQVNFEVREEVGEPGNADCYELRVKLNTAEGGERIKLAPLAMVYPELRGRAVFFDYGFNPTAHTSLSVSVDLVENLARADGEDAQPPGPPAQRAVVAAVGPLAITNEYIPRLSRSTVYRDGCPTGATDAAQPKEPSSLRDGDCYFEVTFDFVQEDYWPETGLALPAPLIYALNTLPKEDVGTVAVAGRSDDTKACRKLTASSPDGYGTRYLSRQDLDAWGSDNAKSLVTTYDTTQLSDGVLWIGLIPRYTLETCGYEAFLIEWKGRPDWPSVVCEQTADYALNCQ